jgi:hypothetical protein
MLTEQRKGDYILDENMSEKSKISSRLTPLALHKRMAVEDSLGLAFAALIRSPDRILPFAALSAVQFESKLRIVDLTAQEALRGDDLLKKWSTLKNKIDRVTKTHGCG